jgi:hypothetical protein
MKIKPDLNNDNLSIVVLSFDGYKDVWPYFFSAFNKFWPNCKYPVYLVNNKINAEYKNVRNIQTGIEINWCTRAREAIKQIQSDYILLLLEDYLIGTKVENSRVDQLMDFIIHNRVDYFRLTNIPKKRSKKYSKDNIYPINGNEEYGINLQASIWRKDFFLKVLDDIDGSAWEFETKLLLETRNGSNLPLNGCFVSTENIIDIHNGILKGKWFPSTIRYFKSKGITINYEGRGKLSLKEVIRYNVRFHLRENMPYGLRKVMKYILRKLGFKFVSDY